MAAAFFVQVSAMNDALDEVMSGLDNITTRFAMTAATHELATSIYNQQCS